MINRYASLRQGLVGAWCPSLGASGFRLIDRSGYGNHGTLTNMDPGTDWVASGSGLALDFDGVDDLVTSPQSSKDYKVPITFSFWAQSSNPQNSYVIAGNDGSQNVFTFGIIFVSGIGYQIDLRYGGAQIQAGDVGSIIQNWNMYTCTISSPTLRQLYLNGSLVGTSTTSLVFPNTVTSLRLGGGDTGARKLRGNLDDIRVYNRALTPSEIRLLYTGGRGIGLIPERIKHRRKTTAAATNRRRRLICGANC